MLLIQVFISATIVIGVVLMGPSPVLSGENRQGGTTQPYPRVIVSGLHGYAMIGGADHQKAGGFLRFHESVPFGDELTTGAGSVVEVLIGKHALVRIDEESTVRFADEAPNQVVVQLTKGSLRLMAAQAEHAVTVRTPMTTAVTYGGLITIQVAPGEPGKVAALIDPGGSMKRVAVAPDTGKIGSVERFDVLEGTVRIQSSASGGSQLTVNAGRGVQIRAGEMREAAIGPSQPIPLPLPAAGAHAVVSPRVVQHLAASQMAQAEELQRTLLQGSDDAEPQVDVRNIILSTSFGVPFPNSSQGAGSSPASSPPVIDTRNVILPTSLSTPVTNPSQGQGNPSIQLNVPGVVSVNDKGGGGPTITLPIPPTLGGLGNLGENKGKGHSK